MRTVRTDQVARPGKVDHKRGVDGMFGAVSFHGDLLADVGVEAIEDGVRLVAIIVSAACIVPSGWRLTMGQRSR